MKYPRKTICLTIFIAGLVYVVQAEDLKEQNENNEFKKIGYPRISSKIADPSLTSPIGPKGIFLNLTTDKTDKKAAAKIGLKIGGDFFIDVKFSTPLEDTESDAEPIDLDGLAKSSFIDLGIHYLSWKPHMDIERAKQILDEYNKRNPLASAKVLTLNYLKKEPDLRRRFLEAITWDIAFFAALRAKIGRQDFSYSNSSFQEINEQKASAALETSIGVLFPNSGYFGFNLEIQKFYESEEAVELILPYEGGPVQQFRKLVMAPPEKKERTKLQVEYRKTIGNFAGVNPKISYFPKEKLALAELPVYLFKSPDNGLNGGVNISWISKDKGRFGLALFIGSAFSISPN